MFHDALTAELDVVGPKGRRDRRLPHRIRSRAVRRRPDVVRFFPDGWRGTWNVDETVRKVYVLVTTRHP